MSTLLKTECKTCWAGYLKSGCTTEVSVEDVWVGGKGDERERERERGGRQARTQAGRQADIYIYVQRERAVERLKVTDDKMHVFWLPELSLA